MTGHSKDVMLQLIRSNIERHGHHVYLVSGGGALPRFAYTIGITQRLGFELVLAGASAYSAEQVKLAVNQIAGRLGPDSGSCDSAFRIDSLGEFSLRPVDESWSDTLMLGVRDHYGLQAVRALQIVPDSEHWTIDTPDLSRAWDASTEPVWQWLHIPWTYPVPVASVATTNLHALRGEKITEAARWEEDQWELFAGSGPDVTPEDARVVPLGTLLAIDNSLEVVTRLSVGEALWREPSGLDWNEWQ